MSAGESYWTFSGGAPECMYPEVSVTAIVEVIYPRRFPLTTDLTIHYSLVTGSISVMNSMSTLYVCA